MIDQEITFAEAINEKSTVYLTGVLTDHLGVVIPLAAVATLVAWVTDEATGAVINSRNGQSILNVAGGTLHATSGAWTLKLGALDSPIVNAALPYERHRILVQWTYNGGVDGGSMEMVLTVRNLSQVP